MGVKANDFHTLVFDTHSECHRMIADSGEKEPFVKKSEVTYGSSSECAVGDSLRVNVDWARSTRSAVEHTQVSSETMNCSSRKPEHEDQKSEKFRLMHVPQPKHAPSPAQRSVTEKTPSNRRTTDGALVGSVWGIRIPTVLYLYSYGRKNYGFYGSHLGATRHGDGYGPVKNHIIRC
ncbi:hypothetical protein B0H19DRAFT_1071456 [Mycena capillaripes]|nr:hypothetical protein B0H19DRAFT_1071456 [Mycena capillaripes]